MPELETGILLCWTTISRLSLPLLRFHMNSLYAFISSSKKHESRIDGKYSNMRACWHVGIAKFEISDANYLLGYEIASLFRSMPELCTWGMRALWAWLPPAGLEPFFSRSWACARPTAPWNLLRSRIASHRVVRKFKYHSTRHWNTSGMCFVTIGVGVWI